MKYSYHKNTEYQTLTTSMKNTSVVATGGQNIQEWCALQKYLHFKSHAWFKMGLYLCHVILSVIVNNTEISLLKLPHRKSCFNMKGNTVTNTPTIINDDKI